MNRLFKRIFGIGPDFPEVNTKRELYIKLCDDADDILVKSGIRKICVECSTVKSYRYAGKNAYTHKGCCEGCKYITPKGCSTKSLACKLWLCDDELERKIRKARCWTKWNNIRKTARRNELLDGYWVRKGIDDYSELEE